MNKKHQALIAAAKKAQKNAFCPLTHYAVGAAVLGESGRIYIGTNVESPTGIGHICAERNAIFSAVAHGERTILATATVCNDSDPCGYCRQMILEFTAGDIPIYSVHQRPKNGGKERLVVNTLSQLMPKAHTLEKLELNKR